MCGRTQFQIPSFLNQVKTIPENESYKPWLESPPSLVEITGEIVNKIPMPECWNWDVDQVVKWLVVDVELSQYKDCFARNFINGRRLLLLDSSVCPKVGIRDFSHIKKITSSIRKLFNVDKESFKRSISLPERFPLTHYLLHRIPTGPKRENTNRTQLFRKMGLIDEEKQCPFAHWEMIDATQPDFPCNHFGLVRCKNVHKREENN
ncbi:sterile alpha motif domain-containing protein 15 [Belonocnema kinseyi]|uniref:sterile alpha motif domain-containing protein 15 n=1 Tax=Belonocnema kinseyi TaxID=2817044 RepID=UPI00143D55A8|nr:sterile alpha motif domain-containing protein 15 [Belonocnema kinseyi]